MLNAVTREYSEGAVVHLDRQGHDGRAPRPLDDLADSRWQIESGGGLVKLAFGVGERIELSLQVDTFCGHGLLRQREISSSAASKRSHRSKDKAQNILRAMLHAV
jgi:hypothetical protein